MDFWNDGEYVGGCIAGGRNYMHINANGDIEPCAFIHYSDSNIYEDTLLEAFENPCSKLIVRVNRLTKTIYVPVPCWTIGELTKIVRETGVASTDLEQAVDVRKTSAKCEDVAKNGQLQRNGFGLKVTTNKIKKLYQNIIRDQK